MVSQIQTETNLVSQFLAFITVVLNIFVFTIVFIAVIVSVQHSNQLLDLKAVFVWRSQELLLQDC